MIQFFLKIESWPLCGQALISMPSFVLVWKRNRSTKQTEQEWWKTKHLFFRPRSPGKRSHICLSEVLFTVSCLPCSPAWPQRLPAEAAYFPVENRSAAHVLVSESRMRCQCSGDSSNTGKSCSSPTHGLPPALLMSVWCILMLLDFKPDFLWGSEKFSCLQEAALEVVLHGYLQCCMGSAHLVQGAVVEKTMIGVNRESLSLQGVFKCKDRQTEKYTPCWSDALE